MSKTRIIGIAVTVAVAVVYFYFNPLSPRIYESSERVKAKAEAQKNEAGAEDSAKNAEALENVLAKDLTPVLSENDLKTFVSNYAQIRSSLENVKLGEIKDPTYDDVKKYCIENGTFDSLNAMLKNYGITSAEPLAVFFAISNGYGIVSYDKALLNNPKQQRIIERMAGETIEKLRSSTHPDDIAIVADNFDILDEAFKKYAESKKKK